MNSQEIRWPVKLKTLVVKHVFTSHCSLGKEKRQLELLRITKENQMIQGRLSQCRPNYNVRSWHEDWLKTLKVMDSIARYPRGTANQQKVTLFFLPFLDKVT